MPRKNHRPTRAQAQRSARAVLGMPPRTPAPRTQVENVVIPDGRCYLNPAKPKAYYNTEAKAAKALVQAQKKRARQGSGYVEKRFYLCRSWTVQGINYHFLNEDDAIQRATELGITPDPATEHWHLTSLESYTPKDRS